MKNTSTYLSTGIPWASQNPGWSFWGRDVYGSITCWHAQLSAVAQPARLLLVLSAVSSQHNPPGGSGSCACTTGASGWLLLNIKWKPTSFCCFVPCSWRCDPCPADGSDAAAFCSRGWQSYPVALWVSLVPKQELIHSLVPADQVQGLLFGFHWPHRLWSITTLWLDKPHVWDQASSWDIGIKRTESTP